MRNPLSIDDAVALLERTSLPTVITEGSDDYRIMRKIEEALADCGVDFLPVGGRGSVLSIWERLPNEKKDSCVAIVDLDTWLYFGIPAALHNERIIYTNGYSIENDIFIDGELIALCDPHERESFGSDLDIVLAWHARQIANAAADLTYRLKTHPNQILQAPDLTPNLTEEELRYFRMLKAHFPQALRGKTLLQLLTRQLSRPQRYVKFGYKQLYEVGSAILGDRLKQMETDIRGYLC